MEELGAACRHLATRLSQMKHMRRKPSSLLGLHQAEAVFEVANGQDEEEQDRQTQTFSCWKEMVKLGLLQIWTVTTKNIFTSIFHRKSIEAP